MTTLAQANSQALALHVAAGASPVPQIAVVLAKRAKEWDAAVSEAEVLDQQGYHWAIFLVGTIESGMTLARHQEPCEVLRVIRQGGDLSLQMKMAEHVTYWNFVSQTSPVVAVLPPANAIQAAKAAEAEQTGLLT